MNADRDDGSRQRTTLERAFELARSGECANIKEIRLRLEKEHYTGVREQLWGQTVRRDLMKLCLAAQGKAPPAPPRRRIRPG